MIRDLRLSQGARLAPRLAFLTAALAVAFGAPAAAKAANGPGSFAITTVPAVAGIHFTFEGTTHVTGASGTTSFPTGSSLAIFRSPYGLSRVIHLRPTKRANGSVYRLQRWYSKSIDGERTLVAALREIVPTKVAFVNPAKGPFPADRVGTVVLRRSDGAVFRFAGEELQTPVYLQATRVVPLTGGLVSKNLLYRVQSVTIEGNNLVNRSQQAFLPALDSSVSLKLLFYSARFKAQDRLFQFGIGSGIHLQFPNGRVHFYRFNDAGEVDLPALPRGNYRVTVDAAGLKVTSPVAMTRDQVATLKVVSYLDLVVLALVAVSLAAGLLLVGRPGLRKRTRALLVRAWRRRSPSEVASA
jgi:hypothetical protein